MKRFAGICIVTGVLCVLLTVLSSVLIDPYNVFHVDRIRDNGVEPNKNYIKMSYLIKNPDRFDSLIVGSSHVGALHVEQMADERCYNMTCPEALPCEQLENLKTLIKNNVIPKRIYLGVDSWSYRGDPERHLKDKRTISYETLLDKKNLYKNYIDPRNALFSLVSTMGHTKNPDFTQIFYDYGWMIGYDMQSAYDWSKIDEYDSGVTNRLDETIEEIEEYINLCKDKGIELIIFINPYCAEEFRKDLENGYKEFLEKLANLHPYYNFCGINEYTVNHDLFIDPSHYNAYLGDEILDVLTGVGKADGDTGWGMYVTTDNIKKFFDVLVPEEMVSVH